MIDLATLPDAVRASFDQVLAEAAARKISRSRLCRAADVHETTVARIINGSTARPDPDTVAKLADALARLIQEKAA